MTATIPQPSFDLAPADYFLFPNLKTPLEGHHHWTLNIIKEVCFIKDPLNSTYQGSSESSRGTYLKCVVIELYFEEFWRIVEISEIYFSRYIFYTPSIKQ